MQRDYYKRRKLGWERRRSQNVQSYGFPNILLDGWEGLKAYTFEKKKQSKGAHFEKIFRHASRGASWPLHFKIASYAYGVGVPTHTFNYNSSSVYILIQNLHIPSQCFVLYHLTLAVAVQSSSFTVSYRFKHVLS